MDAYNEEAEFEPVESGTVFEPVNRGDYDEDEEVEFERVDAADTDRVDAYTPDFPSFFDQEEGDEMPSTEESLRIVYDEDVNGTEVDADNTHSFSYGVKFEGVDPGDIDTLGVTMYHRDEDKLVVNEYEDVDELCPFVKDNDTTVLQGLGTEIDAAGDYDLGVVAYDDDEMVTGDSIELSFNEYTGDEPDYDAMWSGLGTVMGALKDFLVPEPRERAKTFGESFRDEVGRAAEERKSILGQELGFSSA